MDVSRGSVQDGPGSLDPWAVAGPGSLDSWAVAEVFVTSKSDIQDRCWGESQGLVTTLCDVWLLGLACLEVGLSMVELRASSEASGCSVVSVTRFTGPG
jgi:hypothetical protein